MDNPLIVHVGDRESINEIAAYIPPLGEKLIDAFMPGPLTLVVKKKDKVPPEVTAGLNTVGVRWPDHEITESILGEGHLFLAAPSANLSGKPSPTKGEHVLDDLKGKIWGIIEGGDSSKGIESTIVDVTGEVPVLLRPGSITREMLEVVVGDVEVDPHLLGKELHEGPKAPGMKYRHYAPEADVFIYREGTGKEAMEKVLGDKGKKDVMYLYFDGEEIETSFGHKRMIGRREKIGEVTPILYSLLRECDKIRVSTIFIPGVTEKGLGFSYMNRVKKASSNKWV